MLILIHRNGGQKGRGGHVYLDAVGRRQVLHAVQLFHRSVEAPIRNLRVAADISNAVAGQVLQVCIIRRSSLAAELHQHRLLRVPRRGGRGKGGSPVEQQRRRGGGRGEE